MRRCRSASGFTYIEFLCAMGIILILAYSVLLGAMRSYHRAKQGKCLHNLRQIGLALSMYAAESSGRYPPADNDLSPLCPRYLWQPDIFRCPLMPSATETMGPNRLATSYQYQGGLMSDADPNAALASDDRARHRRGINVLYADLRVSFVSADELAGKPMGRLDRYTWADTGLSVPPPQEWTPDEVSEALGR